MRIRPEGHANYLIDSEARCKWQMTIDRVRISTNREIMKRAFCLSHLVDHSFLFHTHMRLYVFIYIYIYICREMYTPKTYIYMYKYIYTHLSLYMQMLKIICVMACGHENPNNAFVLLQLAGCIKSNCRFWSCDTYLVCILSVYIYIYICIHT